MRKFLTIALLFAFTTVLFSCNSGSDQRATYHEAQWSPDQKDSVVYVSYQHDNGNISSFYMNYILFHTLFNRGGYVACYNHYATNPTLYTTSSERTYTSYRPRATKSTFGSGSSTRSYSSPSRSSSSSSPSSSRSYSSPSRSSGSSSSSSSSRSYSSPSRSSSSSPSRGH